MDGTTLLPLIGIPIVVIGFALRFNPLLVVVVAGLATGLLRILMLYFVAREATAGLGLMSLGGHVQTVRPLLARWPKERR